MSTAGLMARMDRVGSAARLVGAALALLTVVAAAAWAFLPDRPPVLRPVADYPDPVDRVVCLEPGAYVAVLRRDPGSGTVYAGASFSSPIGQDGMTWFETVNLVLEARLRDGRGEYYSLRIDEAQGEPGPARTAFPLDDGFLESSDGKPCMRIRSWQRQGAARLRVYSLDLEALDLEATDREMLR